MSNIMDREILLMLRLDASPTCARNGYFNDTDVFYSNYGCEL